VVFTSHSTKKQVISETFLKPISWLGMEKLNLKQQRHTFTNQKKCTTTQNKHRKIKRGLVASYDIRPGNRQGLLWFWCFMNLSLTYCDTYPLTYSPGIHTGAIRSGIQPYKNLAPITYYDHIVKITSTHQHNKKEVFIKSLQSCSTKF